MMDLSWLQQYLFKGDLIGFIQACYTRLIGDLFWGLIIFIFAFYLAVRHQSIIPPAILFLGCGSLLVAFIPYAGYRLGYLLIGLGLSALIYKFIRAFKK